MGWRGIGQTSVVDAGSPSRSRRHQRQYLVASAGSPRGTAQVNVPVSKFTRSQVARQGDRQDQFGIGHRTVVVKVDLDTVVGIISW